MITRATILLTLGLLLGACADGPRDIAIGAEECAHCRMLVSEDRFASQVRTEQGRTYVFDSIECMVEFVQEATATGEAAFRGMWVTDFSRAGEWLSAEESVYLQSPGLRSPMGLNLSAYATRDDAEAHQAEHGGDVLLWAEVQNVVADVTVSGVAGGRSHVH